MRVCASHCGVGDAEAEPACKKVGAMLASINAKAPMMSGAAGKQGGARSGRGARAKERRGSATRRRGNTKRPMYFSLYSSLPKLRFF